MEKSRYCDICKNKHCSYPSGVNDMEFLKPSCYAEVEMVKFEEGCYVPKELCTVNALGEVDDTVPCSNSCNGENCSECIVTKVFNDYARLTNQNK